MRSGALPESPLQEAHGGESCVLQLMEWSFGVPAVLRKAGERLRERLFVEPARGLHHKDVREGRRVGIFLVPFQILQLRVVADPAGALHGRGKAGLTQEEIESLPIEKKPVAPAVESVARRAGSDAR